MFRNQESILKWTIIVCKNQSTLVEFFTLCITSKFPSISYSQASENWYIKSVEVNLSKDKFACITKGFSSDSKQVCKALCKAPTANRPIH